VSYHVHLTVAQLEIDDGATVNIFAILHPREEDYL